MSKISTAFNLIKKNRASFLSSLLKNIGFLFPDKLYLKLMFRCRMGYKLNLKKTKTFNEKMQWLKLYNRNPLYTTLVDKFAVKDYVGQKIGNEYIIPTIGVWTRAEDIVFDDLPNQFVLKTTNGGGGSVIICKDKSTFDKIGAVRKLKKSLKDDLYKISREWPYKNVPPRIIAEKYMEDYQDGELRDYKFYTFNGIPKFMLIVSNRYGKQKYFDYFDMQFNRVNLQDVAVPNSRDDLPHKPQNFEEMKRICQQLAGEIPMVRVDLYEINGKVYFGEMTFFDDGGFMNAKPKSWEREWGDLINLPVKEMK